MARTELSAYKFCQHLVAGQDWSKQDAYWQFSEDLTDI